MEDLVTSICLLGSTTGRGKPERYEAVVGRQHSDINNRRCRSQRLGRLPVLQVPNFKPATSNDIRWQLSGLSYGLREFSSARGWFLACMKEIMILSTSVGSIGTDFQAGDSRKMLDLYYQTEQGLYPYNIQTIAQTPQASCPAEDENSFCARSNTEAEKMHAQGLGASSPLI